MTQEYDIAAAWAALTEENRAKVGRVIRCLAHEESTARILRKFDRLPPDRQEEILTVVDGMLAEQKGVLPEDESIKHIGLILELYDRLTPEGQEEFLEYLREIIKQSET